MARAAPADARAIAPGNSDNIKISDMPLFNRDDKKIAFTAWRMQCKRMLASSNIPVERHSTFILGFYFLYFNSKLHVISVISHVMFENIPPAQHPVLQQDASSLLLVYFLVSIKPLIRVSYLVTFGSRLCF